jgi:1-deoxy-D-xylulose-5-phosphate reductoisomerase
LDKSLLQKVTILGSTGTIGQQTLDVISLHQSAYEVFALAANSSVEKLFKQCLEYRPKYAVLLDANAARKLRIQLAEVGGLKTQVLTGMAGLVEISEHHDVDVVMAAIVGAAGLLPALAAAKAGKRILLANKETLVMAGSLFMQAVQQGQATLLPIDSEHNAIFQVMPAEHKNAFSGGVKKIILTASGGPFRSYSPSQLQQVTPALALKHPNWVMGSKITIDSATLMNKGLEVIEAYWLFQAKPSQIEVVVHPQSVIHSMVEYVDGSILAQLGNPDMRTPIAYGLSYPQRIVSGVSSLNLIEIARLEFEPPDLNRFPCLKLAYDVLATGGTAPTVLNAVNEIAVEAFLSNKLRFVEIAHLIETALNDFPIAQVESIPQLLAVDEEARSYARQWIADTKSTGMLSA